jgi:lipopolysaccharide exporter
VSLVQKTVRGALWTISTGIGSRVVGLVCTLAITRFVDPSEYGEVMVAAVLVMTASQFSTIGFGQYIVSNPAVSRATTFHATVFHVGLGIVALGAVLGVGGLFAPLLEAPRIMHFLPGLVVSALVDRLSFMPERILVKDLRFGMVASGRSAGELVYSGLSVTLAAVGWGAMALVAANVARSLVRAAVFIGAADRKDWLEPCRLSLARTRELLAFGVPLAIGALCGFASRRWDNLVVSRFFGPGAAGMYNLAYNLADVPAIQVGEQVGDVLVPSFARMDPERRPAALLRSLTLLALVVFPLAVGLGAVADTVVRTLLDPRWRPVAPMLMVLSALSVTRPIGWTVTSYLQARQMPRLIMCLDAFRLAVLMIAILTLGRLSPLWACIAVGVAFGAHMLATFWAVRRIDGIPVRRSLGSIAGPLVACAPLVVAVFLARRGLAAAYPNAPSFVALALEVLAGAAAYVAAAFTVAPKPLRELLTRVVDAVRRRPPIAIEGK